MTLFPSVILFCLTLQSCITSQPLNRIEIEKGHLLDNFNKGGATSHLLLFYKSYSSNNDQLKKELFSGEIDVLKRALETAKTKKHTQKKITGIYAAVELCSKEKCNSLLLTETVVYHISKEYQLSLKKEF